MRQKFYQILIVVALITFFSSQLYAQPKEGNYLLGTASIGGTFYPVGVALSSLTKVKLEPKYKVGMSAISSAGSGENIKLLRENEIQFAILQGLFGSYAWNGTGPIAESGKQRELRSITMLWQNVEHFVIAKSVTRKGTANDFKYLKGKKMAFGSKNSGTIGSNTKILENLGIDINSFDLFHAGYGPSADALQDGRVDGVSIPAGVPTGAITKLFAAAGDKITPINFTDAELKKADGRLKLWTRYVIPANTYPGQTSDWKTIAQPNILVTREDIDEEFVYLLTKTIYENLAFLNAIHSATKVMSLEKAIEGLSVPLHPGAVRYYQEMGIKIPRNLIAR